MGNCVVFALSSHVVGAVCVVVSVVGGCLNLSYAQAADVAALAGGDLGLRRAALLRSLFGDENVIPLGTVDVTAPDYVGMLRLDEAVALSLKSNHEVLAAESKKEGLGWDVIASYGQYAPQVKFTRSSGTERNQPASYNDSVGARVNDDKHHRMDRILQIQQPIIDVSVISDILQRRLNDDVADMERIGTRERIAMDTVKAYLNLMQAVLSIRYAETYKASLDTLTERMAARVAGGGANQADLERVRARAVMAESAIISARSELDAVQSEFRRLTGVVPETILVPDEVLPAFPDDVEAAVRRAMVANPEYLASDLRAESTQMESYKAYSSVLPKLSFEVSRTTTFNAGGAAKGNPIDGGPWAYQHEDTAMLVMTWSFNGGADLLQGIGYGARAQEARYKTLDVRARVEESLRNGYSALRAADQRITATRQALQANQKVASSFEEQYLAANRPLFDLLDAYDRLYSSRLELVRLLTAEAKAAYQVRRLMGELVGAVQGAGKTGP